MSVLDHNYCEEMSSEKFGSGSKHRSPPTTPSTLQQQAKKKNKPEDEKQSDEEGSTLMTILEAVTTLSHRFDIQKSKTEKFGAKMEANYVVLAETKEEVSENKKKTESLEKQLTELQEEIITTKEKRQGTK